MAVTRLAIVRPIAVLMLISAFVILGLVGYSRLPAELNPKVDFPTVTVFTQMTGTNPQEMETLITKPIEDSISGVSGMKEIDSTSQEGISVITCQFYIGTDLDTATADVRDKVDAVRTVLPTAAQAPSVVKQDNASQPILYIAMQGNESPRALYVLANNVVQERLEQAPDVSSVNIYGGDQREIRIACRADRLAAYGLTIQDVDNDIINANVNVASGYIQTNSVYDSIRFIGEFASVDEIRKLWIDLPNGSSSSSSSSAGSAAETGILNPVTGLPVTASSSGSTSSTSSSGPPNAVRLSDIADVYDTIVERTAESTLDGRPSVTMAILKTSDGNTLRAVDGVKKELAAVKQFLPPDITFTLTRDTSVQVHDNLNDVMTSLFLGALLAILVVYVFLHNIRAVIIIAIAIPVCIISTFLPIALFGFTLNSMTLLGLSLSIGILIDDSIVVLENIVRHLRMGQEPAEAALNGRGEIGLAALTLTSVDVVVFVPIAFMGGIIGQFFQSFGLSITIAVLLSLFVSFTLTPMLASRWFKKGEDLEGSGTGRGFGPWFDRGYHRFENTYRRILNGALRHPWMVFLIGNGILVAAVFFIAPQLGFRFAPSQDQNAVAITVQGPAGVSMYYTKTISDEIERRIRANTQLNNDIKFLLTTVGRDQTGGQGSGDTGTQYANIQATLYDRAAPLDRVEFWHHTHLRYVSDAVVADRIRAIVANIPGAKIQAFEINGFGGGGAPLTINVMGLDFAQLTAAADKVQAVVKAIPGVYNTDQTFKASQPELDIRLDRVRAAQYGLDVNTVSQVVSTALQGDNTSKFRDPADGEQYDIRVQLEQSDRNNIYTIGNLPVAYQNGNAVRLSDVANLSMGVGPTRIDRLNRLRSIGVTGYLMPGTQIGNVKQKVDPILQKMAAAHQLGQTTYQWGGEAQTMGDEFPYLIQAVLLGIILSYMLMAALFNNMLYPISVMLTMPQAWVGCLIALLITGTPFSLIAAIGVIMLNGIATKNAILMVDYTNTLRARGYKRIDALREAAPTRLRPILMTSFCIIGATLPTAAALGRGAGFRQALGITVVGGVIVSTILTLLVIPCSYLIYDQFSNWLSRVIWRQQPPRMLAGTRADGNGYYEGDGGMIVTGHEEPVGPRSED